MLSQSSRVLRGDGGGGMRGGDSGYDCSEKKNKKQSCSSCSWLSWLICLIIDESQVKGPTKHGQEDMLDKGWILMNIHWMAGIELNGWLVGAQALGSLDVVHKLWLLNKSLLVSVSAFRCVCVIHVCVHVCVRVRVCVCVLVSTERNVDRKTLFQFLYKQQGCNECTWFRWQVTAKLRYTLLIWLIWMKWLCKLVHGCMVYTEPVPRQQQFHEAPAM